MDQKDWILIVELSKQKNITKTATALFVSQPSLSYRMKRIEEELAVKLFIKTSKGIEFTPEGEHLVSYATHMLETFLETKDFLQGMSDEVRGTLRIGASSNFAQYSLPKLLKGFSDLYPNVRFKVRTGWSSDVFNMLQDSTTHIGIIRSDYTWKGEKHLLNEEQFYIISNHKIDLKDLPLQPYVTYKTDVSLSNSIQSWWNDRYDEPPAIEMELDRLETCKEMVKQGLGFAIVPGISLSEEEELFKMKLSYLNGEPLVRRTWLYTDHKSIQLPIVQRFNQYCKQWFE